MWVLLLDPTVAFHTSLFHIMVYLPWVKHCVCVCSICTLMTFMTPAISASMSSTTCYCHDYHQARIFIGYTIFTAMSGMHSHREYYVAIAIFILMYINIIKASLSKPPLAAVEIYWTRLRLDSTTGLDWTAGLH